ncbi:MAG: glycosyltransferase family 39 protein [Eubacteriales bacterium]|nr:glycosyltransferase family 39 protein [Eubacteriales bacterium]
MRKKNVLEYIILAIFIMCMSLALCASLEYVTRATEREYLNQAKWLFMVLGASLSLFLLMRITHKTSKKLTDTKKWWAYGVGLGVFWIAGLALRISVIEGIPIQPSSDFETYYNITLYLLQDKLLTPIGDSYREYIALYPHTIGFPMMILAPAFEIFGASVKTALYTNLLFSMGSVLLTARIARRCAGKTAGLLAGAAMALWPSHIFYSDMIATEPTFTFFILAATNFVVSVVETGEKSLFRRDPVGLIVRYVLLGILLAVAGAIRPMAIILLAAFVVVRILMGQSTGDDVRNSALQKYLSKNVVCILLVFVPYFLVSQSISSTIGGIIMETPASGLGASGYNLMVGVNSSSEGLWNQEDADFFKEAYLKTGTASGAHAECMQEALRRIQQQPEDVLNLLVYKFRDLWGTDDFGIDWNLLWTGQQGLLTQKLVDQLEAVRPFGRAAYMCILFFSLLSGLDAWRKARAPAPLQMLCILFFLGTALSHMLLETQVRYHYNMIPYLILLSAFTVAGWQQRMADEQVIVVQERKALSAEKPTSAAGSAQATTVQAPSSAPQMHNHFDIMQALREGHVQMSVSQAYVQEEMKERGMQPNQPIKPVKAASAENQQTNATTQG